MPQSFVTDTQTDKHTLSLSNSTEVEKKKTDCQAFLYRELEHPESLKCSIPYAKALFLKRLCTKDHNFKANSDILSKKFIDRGYKKAKIYDSISKTFERNNGDLLTQNNEPKCRIPITLTYP